MYRQEGQHTRDRRFEITVPLHPVSGCLLIGGHPECLDEHVRTNLRTAAQYGEPVLRGVITRGTRVNVMEKTPCMLYSGHVEADVTDEQAEDALNKLASNFGSYLKAPSVEVSLGDQHWELVSDEFVAVA